MKTFIPFIFLLVLTGKSQPPYQIKSCKVDFMFNSWFLSGTKTIIFADSGKVEKMSGSTDVDTASLSKLTSKFNGQRTHNHSMLIQTPDSVFSIDLDSMTAYTRKRNPLKIAFDNGIMKNKVGEDTLLGRKCTIVQLDGFRIWYWKGIALKKETDISHGSIVLEHAVFIDEGYIIKEDEFKIPKGVRIAQ